MIKLSVNETKWSSFLARTRALILYISIWIFDFGPEKLPGLSRNGPQESYVSIAWILQDTDSQIYAEENLNYHLRQVEKIGKRSERAWSGEEKAD